MQQNQKSPKSHVSHDANNLMMPTLPEGSITRLGHGYVYDIALSPDGEYLAVGTGIGLWWYECVTMTAVDLWDTEQGAISTLTFSADGKWIATAGEDGSVKVWDVSRRACITRIERREKNNRLTRQDKISRIAFSPDSQQLAVSGMHDYIVDIWHPETGEHLAKINADHQVELWQYCGLVRPIAFSPDSQRIACLTPHIPNTATEPEAESISVWDVSNGECIASLAKYPPGVMWYAFCFSLCGESLVASGDVDDKLQAWDTNSWEKIKTYPDHGADQMIPSYSAEGVLHAAAVSNGTNTITVWNVEHNKKIYTSQSDEKIRSLHFMNGTKLAIASSHGFKVEATDTQQTVTSSQPHTINIPGSLAFSNDGETLVAGYPDEGIRLWNVADPSRLPTVFKLAGRQHRIHTSTDRKICIISQMGEKTFNISEVGNHDNPITKCEFKERPTHGAVAFAPENQLLAYGDSQGRLHLWDMQYREVVSTYSAHRNIIDHMKFSSDEKLLASYGEIGPDFRLWDIEHQEDISGTLNNLIEYEVAFSPCGSLMAAPTQNEILLWDVTQRQTQIVIPKPERWTYQGPWHDILAFSPCGQYLASGSSWVRGMKKSWVQLWKVANGENIATFEGHTSDITDLAFSPNTELLASASFDGTILLWDLKPYL